VGSITLQSTSLLTVSSSVEYYGSYTYGFILKSEASSTASLILPNFFDYFGSNQASVERYLTGNTWHNVSPTVTGDTVSNFLILNAIPTKINGDTTIYGSEYYDEAAGGWTFYTTNNLSDDITLTPGMGILVRTDNDGTVTFTGDLNYGTVSVSIDSTRNGWNSIGNPYTSSLALNSGTGMTNFLTENASNVASGFAVYLWNGSFYTTISNSSGSTFLQPGQGFIVKSANGGSSVSFTSAMQAHQNPTFYKKNSTADNWYRSRLAVTTESDTAKTEIVFREDMTKGLDQTYDASGFGGNTNFQVYTQFVQNNSLDLQLAIQCLPSLEEEDMVIPVGFDCTAGGNVTFSAGITSLPAGYSYILEDRTLNVFTDLNVTGAKYEVTISPETSGFGRFYIHTMSGANGLPQDISSVLQVYAANREIFVKGNIENYSFAYLYDITGKKVAVFELQPGTENRFAVDGSLSSGIYFLSVTGNGTNKTSKVFIN